MPDDGLPTATVVLKPKRARPFFGRHPWVLDSAVLRVEGDPADGDVVDGCNVENASYGLCICAERTAVSAAVSMGKQKFTRIAIATGSSPPAAPCGMCRQVLAEFAGDDEMVIILVNDKGERSTTTLQEIFPGTFNQAQLASGQKS